MKPHKHPLSKQTLQGPGPCTCARTLCMITEPNRFYWSVSGSNKQQLCFERDKAEKANENIPEKLCRIS